MRTLAQRKLTIGEYIITYRDIDLDRSDVGEHKLHLEDCDFISLYEMSLIRLPVKNSELIQVLYENV